MEFAWGGGLLQEGWLWGEVWREAAVQVTRAGWEAWLRHGGRQGQCPGESQELPDPDNGTVLSPAFGWVSGFSVFNARSAL